MGLNAEEYCRIVDLLGREPNLTELGMFAVMWSEHCGYKYSRPVLALFKNYREALEGKGFENAGIVDIGDGLGVTMKVESHNHPSAVEPYEGAATGVGGIIRDILTMGARPIASLNSLRFGPIVRGQASDATVARNRYLMEHVVAGIAGYGNCVGVPTVGGEVSFHPKYSGNPLVNAMCVGLLKLDEVTTAAATGVGNPVLYLGSATGKDGIHGATFASDTLDENSEVNRPNVQIGDPFAEKQLIEATLEALQTGAIVAIQDMGAAGLTCSTIEMASKGDVGMDVNLDLVPMREEGMTAYELMLSESQERMLAVAIDGREDEVVGVFRKWGLKAAVVGRVTDDGLTTIRRNGRIEAQVPAKLLTDHCPTYTTSFQAPPSFAAAGEFRIDRVPVLDAHETLGRLLASPEIGSKRWVYRQYDESVQTQTTLGSGAGDAAVLAPRGTDKGVALTIDGNSRQTALHPYRGGQLAVVESARNVACVGARPQAITDGLNFGNPQLSHVYWQFRESVRGIADAAAEMRTPVISGNVSFYNQSDLGEAPPTPLIGMLGILDRADARIGVVPTTESGTVCLLSVRIAADEQLGLGASAYLAIGHAIENGWPAAPDVPGERRLCEAVVEAVEGRYAVAAHDCSEGGLAVTLAEIVSASRSSIDVDLRGSTAETDRLDATLFGELPGRVVLCCSSRSAVQEIARIAERHALNFDEVGTFSVGDSLSVRTREAAFSWTGAELRDAHEGALERALQTPI